MFGNRSQCVAVVARLVLIAVLTEHLFCALLHHEDHHHAPQTAKVVCHHDAGNGHTHSDTEEKPSEPCSEDHDCDHCIGHRHIAWKPTANRRIEQLTCMIPTIGFVASVELKATTSVPTIDRLRGPTLDSGHHSTVILT